MKKNWISRLPLQRFYLAQLVGCFLFISGSAGAQSQEIQRLKKELKSSGNGTKTMQLLNDLVWEYTSENTDSAIWYGKKAVDHARRIQDKPGEINARRYMGLAYANAGNTQKALSLFKQALRDAVSIKDDGSIAVLNNDLGSVYEGLSDYDKSVFHYYEALRILERLGDRARVGGVSLNLSYLYVQLDDMEQALVLANQALKNFEEGDPRIAQAHLLRAMVYDDINKYKEAESELKKALGLIPPEQEENATLRSSILNSLGLLYHHQEEYDKALDYFWQSFRIDNSLGNMAEVAVSYANIGCVYGEMGDQEKSALYLGKAVSLAKKHGSLEQLMEMMDLLAKNNYLKGEYKQAYDYQTIYNQISDSIFSEQKNEQILKIREEYESVKKDQQIENLHLEKEALNSRLIMNYLLLGALILFLVFVIAVILLYQRIRVTREKLIRYQLEQQALRARMNPHFIFNSLNSIQRLYIEGKDDLANDFMADFASLLRSVLNNSGKDFISLQDEIELSKMYLELERMRSDGHFDYQFDIDSSIVLSETFVPPLLLQPYLENAIWHGILPDPGRDTGMIRVTVTRTEDNYLECIIADTGIGYNTSLKMKPEGTHESKGMQITGQRLGMLGSVSIYQPEEGGTVVTLKIPLRNDQSSHY